MAQKPMSMLKRKEIKRLRESGLSVRAIAQLLKCSRNTIKKYWNEKPEPPSTTPAPDYPLWSLSLDWESLHGEHTGRGVPLRVLWEEEAESGRIPVGYPAFWKQYRRRHPELPKTMVRFFKPGERVEIDYCDGIDIVSPATGEVTKTHFFVGCLCFSRYTYAEFTLSQKSRDFLGSHVRMFEYFGGVAATLAPDNLKSGVSKAHRYDPEINPAYVQLAEHFGITVTPARVRRPTDKPIVERTIQIFQKWFYFRVRNKRFTSLVELNKSARKYLDIFHAKVHRVFKRSRKDMFEEEKAHLLRLPCERYEVRTHARAKLSYDCHLQFEKNYYSAPWNLRGKTLDVWVSDRVVEIFHKGECVGVHGRSPIEGKFKTDKKHYPPEHRAYLETTPDYLRKRAEKIGPNALAVVEKLMNVDHPLRHLRRCRGLVELGKKYTDYEIDLGCRYALEFDKYHINFIESVIKTQRNNPEENIEIKITRGHNPHLRGLDSYH